MICSYPVLFLIIRLADGPGSPISRLAMTRQVWRIVLKSLPTDPWLGPPLWRFPHQRHMLPIVLPLFQMRRLVPKQYISATVSYLQQSRTMPLSRRHLGTSIMSLYRHLSDNSWLKATQPKLLKKDILDLKHFKTVKTLKYAWSSIFKMIGGSWEIK